MGTVTPTLILDIPPSLVVSVSQMLYDFGKVSSSVRAADAAVAQQQAMVMLNIDQVAHDTAGAVVQLQGYQKLVKIARGPGRFVKAYWRSYSPAERRRGDIAF